MAKTLRVATWNVNGIRSVAQKGFLEWMERHAPDLVCLQEVKARPEQLESGLLSPPGYQSFWFPAEKPGYSGVAIYSKLNDLQVEYGFEGTGPSLSKPGSPDKPSAQGLLFEKEPTPKLSKNRFDQEGRVISVTLSGQRGPLTLINAYFPNSQRDHSRLGYKLDFCSAMLNHLKTLEGKGHQLVLCGDFNIAHKPIDLRNPKANEDNAGYLPEERAWLDTLVGEGFRDAFRQIEPGGGHYTWWSYRPGVREKNIGWRLDYHFVSENMTDSVKNCKIEPSQTGSDHCPVWLELTY